MILKMYNLRKMYQKEIDENFGYSCDNSERIWKLLEPVEAHVKANSPREWIEYYKECYCSNYMEWLIMSKIVTRASGKSLEYNDGRTIKIVTGALEYDTKRFRRDKSWKRYRLKQVKEEAGKKRL